VNGDDGPKPDPIVGYEDHLFMARKRLGREDGHLFICFLSFDVNECGRGLLQGRCRINARECRLETAASGVDIAIALLEERRAPHR
jgi:hypothetical protein